jgi:hypothetical protein
MRREVFNVNSLLDMAELVVVFQPGNDQDPPGYQAQKYGYLINPDIPNPPDHELASPPGSAS